MGINKYSTELESYFSRKLSGADRILFEGRVESDPVLKTAFDHQNEIVEGLKAHRISELKTRLNNISVEPSLMGTLMQSSIMKSVTLGVTGLMVAMGAYLFYNTESAIEYHIERLEGKVGYSLSNGIDSGANYNLDYKFNKSLRVLDFVEPNPTLNTKEVANTRIISKQSQPVMFEVPEVTTSDYSEDIVSNEVDPASLDRMEKVSYSSSLEKVNIQTVSSRRYNFHYRLEDNRLFLYGKFGVSPYEIIEVTSPVSKKLFFYYQDNFYQLKKSSSTITPLSKIQNQELVQQLEIIRNKGQSLH